MSKQIAKKTLEINHTLSGYHGQQLKNSAWSIYETRKETLKRLQRKKKLAAAISDELYGYLQKYPEQVEKLGLHQQSFKKKKARMLEGDEKGTYSSPAVYKKYNLTVDEDPYQELKNMEKYFKFPLVIQMDQQVEDQ